MHTSERKVSTTDMDATGEKKKLDHVRQKSNCIHECVTYGSSYLIGFSVPRHNAPEKN